MEYRLTEAFRSLQGEGPSAGAPAVFLRLQGCDVGCAWCDTRYSWPAEGGETLASEALWNKVESLGPAPLLVIAGGEPLQHPGIAPLLEQAVARWRQVEVETSGIEPPPLRHERLAYNVSPKLPSATPRWRETWRHASAWVAEPRATFKIVVGDPPDPDDAERVLAEHRVPAGSVMLMPEGLTDEAVRRHGAELAALCVRHGWRLSPRLHVWLWGPKRGV